jgi:predicted MPP superfamily phosphohydrolase
MPWTLRMLLLFTLAGALFQWYVARKTINAVATVTSIKRRKVRLTAWAVLFWLVLHPLLMFGSYFLGLSNVSQALQRSSLFVDALITYPFWAGVVFSIQVALLFLVMDAVRILLFPIYKKNKARWQRTQAWLVIALVCAGAIYVVARIYNDTFTVRTRERELRIANLPKELEGFRIAQIADVQADGRTGQSKLQRYIASVNSLKPDLILFGGDLVTGGVDYIDIGAEALSKMEAKHGIYSCLGDHDYFSNRDMVVRSLESHGITVLDNVATLVPVGSTYISLTGITNVYRTRPTMNALETIEQQRPRGPVNILLTHQPSEWLINHAVEKDYDLLVAGHTHGGQIVFPLPGFLLTGSSFETRYVSGFYDAGPLLVSINNGLGLTLAPIRYHAPAEVTLISLKGVE